MIWYLLLNFTVVLLYYFISSNGCNTNKRIRPSYNPPVNLWMQLVNCRGGLALCLQTHFAEAKFFLKESKAFRSVMKAYGHSHYIKRTYPMQLLHSIHVGSFLSVDYLSIVARPNFEASLVHLAESL